MNLGLDLSGGVHFLLEVDMDTAMETRMDSYVDAVKDKLRENRLRYRRVSADTTGLVIASFRNAESRDEASDLLRDEYREFTFDEKDGEFFDVTLRLLDTKIVEIRDLAIEQNLNALRNRVNALGVSEPIVQRQGQNRIVVQLPGVQDSAEAKRIIGRTASLEFRLVDMKNDLRAAMAGRVPPGSELFPMKDDTRLPVLLEKRVIVSGDRVIGAQASYDENGLPQVNISLDGKGGKMMNRVTKDNVGNQMSVLFVEHKSRLVKVTIDGVQKERREKFLRKYVINVATIQSALGNSFRITGLDSPAESSELALLLRSGALAAPMYFVEERTVGPSLGLDNIRSGVMSFALGLALVVVFMIGFYKVFGVFAVIALSANLVLLTAAMSILGATLTLPGIAGMVLTIGMAVDANVLIFARIKEELANGLPTQQAIHSGYDRAFVAIIDANLTTFIVAVILYAIGTGPVKGFAVTLMLGILTSMFTAILGTRALVNLTYGGRGQAKLWI